MEHNKISEASHTPDNEKEVQADGERELVNSSGHVQEIDRTFSLVSICFMSVLTDNVSNLTTKDTRSVGMKR